MMRKIFFMPVLLGCTALFLGHQKYTPASESSESQNVVPPFYEFIGSSEDGGTYVWLEMRQGKLHGGYRSKNGNNEVYGSISNVQLTRKVDNSGNLYRGTFEDSDTPRVRGSSSVKECTGSILIESFITGDYVRRGVIEWNVTGGKGCTNIGQTFRLDLKEPLPRPVGLQYLPESANTFLTSTAGYSTWPYWMVTRPQLPCLREGVVVSSYAIGSTVDIETRAPALHLANGEARILTSQGCYIVANTGNVRPLSTAEYKSYLVD